MTDTLLKIDTLLADVGFSARTSNCLKRASSGRSYFPNEGTLNLPAWDLATLYDLSLHSEFDLLDVTNLGVSSVEEIRHVLAQAGLFLAGEDPTNAPDTPISKAFGSASRITRSLRYGSIQIDTDGPIAQLTQVTAIELLRQRNFGATCLAEVEKVLADAGLSLAQDEAMPSAGNPSPASSVVRPPRLQAVEVEPMESAEQLLLLVRARNLAASGKGKEVRLRSGLSLGAVARAVGANTTTIYRWEQGQRPRLGPSALAWVKLIESLDEGSA